MLSYVRLVKLIPLKSPKIASWKKTFRSLDLRILKNILQIGEAKVSKFTFMHTLSESKSSFEIEEDAIVSCFVKKCCVFIGTPDISSKGFDKSYPKMYFSLKLSHCVQSYGHLCQILPCPLTKYGHDT